jgi:hypothetical protein
MRRQKQSILKHSLIFAFLQSTCAKKVANPMVNFLYFRDPFEYSLSLQAASDRKNSPVQQMRQKYFDSTEYNYQYYYKIDRNPDDENKIIKEGKLIGDEENFGKIILEHGSRANRPNSSAIEAWLGDYEKLMMNKDTTSQEAIYQLLGAHPDACKFRYPYDTYTAGSFHHALVGRPFKRKIIIPNGDYQFYHWQLWNKYMLEKHYQYAQKAFPSLTEGSEFFPLWTAIGGHGYLKSMERNSKGKPTGKKIVDKTDMIGTHAYGNRTYVDLDWHPKGHMESHHFEKPLRRLRAGMIKPLYLRDQFRLPPCMSPRQIKKQRAGFVNDYFGEPKLTKGEPDWYQQFQAFPSVWDEMCRSPAGRGDVHIDGEKTGQKVIPKCQEYLRMKSSILSDNNMVEFLANDDKVQEQKTKFEVAKGQNWNGKALFPEGQIERLNGTVTEENMFKLWQKKRLMMTPAWNTPMLRTHDGTLNDARVCAIYPFKPGQDVGAAKADPYRRCVHRYLMRRFNKKVDESAGFQTTFNKCHPDKIASGDAVGDNYSECLWRELDAAKKTEAKPEVIIFEEEEPEPPPPPPPVEKPVIKPVKQSSGARAVISLVFIFISMLI